MDVTLIKHAHSSPLFLHTHTHTSRSMSSTPATYLEHQPQQHRAEPRSQPLPPPSTSSVHCFGSVLLSEKQLSVFNPSYAQRTPRDHELVEEGRRDSSSRLSHNSIEIHHQSKIRDAHHYQAFEKSRHSSSSASSATVAEGSSSSDDSDADAVQKSKSTPSRSGGSGSFAAGSRRDSTGGSPVPAQSSPLRPQRNAAPPQNSSPNGGSREPMSRQGSQQRSSLGAEQQQQQQQEQQQSASKALSSVTSMERQSDSHKPAILTTRVSEIPTMARRTSARRYERNGCSCR